MTFQPQYGFWALEKFNTSGGAIFSDSTKVTITNAVAKYLPHYSGSYAYDGPWESPVYGWQLDNKLTSVAELSGDFHSYKAISGALNIESTFSDQALYTFAKDIGTGSWTPDSYAWQTGQEAAIFSYSKTIFNASTVQFDVRVVSGESTTSFHGSSGLSGLLYPSVIMSYPNMNDLAKTKIVIVEPRPDGFKIHGTSGAFFPVDLASSSVRTRLNLDVQDYNSATTRLVITTDDGQSMSIDGVGIDNTISTGIWGTSFGSVPFSGLSTFSGHATQPNINTLQLDQYYDPLGVSGFAGFSGKVIWDNIKITYAEDAGGYSEEIGTIFDNSEETVYTDAWHINPEAGAYNGAWIKWRNGFGESYAKVSVQVNTPSGLFSDTQWQTVNTVPAYTITGVTGDLSNINSSTFIDLSSVSLYSAPFDNAIRFKIDLKPEGSPPPEIESILVMGTHPSEEVTLSPNWKNTAIPQDVYVTINKESFLSRPPVASSLDQVFLHNEANESSIAGGQHITGSISTVTGEIVSNVTAGTSGGFTSVKDGRFNTAAWRNFNLIGNYTGDFNLQSDRYINTGNFEGNLLDTYIYTHEDNPLVQSGASVIFDVADYSDLDGETKPVQIVKVYGYTGLSTEDIGITVDNIGLPTGSNPAMGVIEGTIHIPYGPGVRVTLHDKGNDHEYFLEGELYREPQSFGVAAILTGDRTVPSTGNRISFGVLPRVSNPGAIIGYSTWEDKITQHDHDEFYLYNVTGYIADQAHAKYANITADAQSRPVGLDPNFVYDEGGSYEDNWTDKPYYPLTRESFILEGYIRPYGIIASQTALSGKLFECINSNGAGGSTMEGLDMYLHKDGSITARFDLAIDRPSYGLTGYDYGITPLGSNTYGGPVFSFNEPFTLDSGEEKVSFGHWNHVALCMDFKGMGDTYSGANQPLLDESGIITHGARVGRVYLAINGKPVDHIDATPNTYGTAAAPRYYIPTGYISAGVPATDTPCSAFPPFTRWKTALTAGGALTARTLKIGERVLCDFDHVRFAIRSSCDIQYDVAVNGAKTALPTFQPYDSPKVPTPISGDFSHMEFAHIFRLDYPDEYFGWDEGYSPNHLYVDNYTYKDELKSYTVKSKDFISREIGPKGRQAVRVGPGAELKMKWSAWDERVFNGTGSFLSSLPSQALYPLTPGTAKGAEAVIQGEIFKQTSSNSHFKIASFCKINELPSDDRVSDIFTYNERASDSEYGDGQAYLGVNSNSQLVYGTRINHSLTDVGSIGPFTGATIPTGQWVHLGLDAKLNKTSIGQGSTYMRTYISGEQDSINAVSLTTAGGAIATSGYPFGMDGSLSAAGLSESSHQRFKSGFRFGGLPPVNVTDRTWLNQYSDISYSELVIGYQFDSNANSSWDWTALANTGSISYNGKADLAFSDITTQIGTLIGTGNGEAALYTGVFTYPATPIEDAGQKSIWVTAGANDFERLLMAGMPLISDGKFNNAESYYAIYNDDNSKEILGATDSPIQIAQTVPNNAVNLALISTKEWAPDGSATLFDLSDSNINNITNKYNAQFNIKIGANELTGDAWSAMVSTDIDNKDVRITPHALYNKESEVEHSAFFMHVIGKDEKGIYIPSALDHEDVTGDIDLFLSNKYKVLSSIKIKKEDGTDIPYNLFPYDIISSPYSPDKDISTLSDDARFGYGTGYSGDIANDNGTFTAVLIAEYQSIDEPVFIHYPSINYTNGNINMQDSDVYNPVPIMREQIAPTDISGNFTPLTGYYTLQKNSSSKEYTTFLWYADVTGGFDNLD